MSDTLQQSIEAVWTSLASPAESSRLLDVWLPLQLPSSRKEPCKKTPLPRPDRRYIIVDRFQSPTPGRTEWTVSFVRDRWQTFRTMNVTVTGAPPIIPAHCVRLEPGKRTGEASARQRLNSRLTMFVCFVRLTVEFSQGCRPYRVNIHFVFISKACAKLPEGCRATDMDNY